VKHRARRPITVDQEGLSFDFKLRDGITSTSNAIRLLKYLGYPERIVKRAMKLET